MPRGDTVTLAPTLARLLRDLRALPPHERAYAAGRILTEMREGKGAFEELRREAVVEMRGAGLSIDEIATLVDLGHSTVHGLATGRVSPRRRLSGR